MARRGRPRKAGNVMAQVENTTAVDEVEANLIPRVKPPVVIRCPQCKADTFVATRHVRLRQDGTEEEKAREYRCLGCHRIANFKQIVSP